MNIHKQIIRYIIVGCINAAVDFTLLNFSIIILHFSLFWATFLGFIGGSLTGYFLHSRWTFAYNAQGRELPKLLQLLGVGAVGLALTEVIVHILTLQFGVHYNYAKLAAIAVSVAWAFSASKWWVFRQTENTSKKTL